MSCIEKLKNSDQDAFNEIFRDYHKMLYRYILKRTSSAYYAEEVTQLVFIKLWNYRSKLSLGLTIEVQLFRIAKTTLIDYLRKMEISNKAAFSLQGQHLPEAQDDISNAIALKETNNKIKTLITSLPPVRKQVFEMSRFNNLTHREISERLCIAPKTVENHINMALKYLRAFFI